MDWQRSGDYEDIFYETSKWPAGSGDELPAPGSPLLGIAKVTINRPEVRNAFRPQTLFELSDAFEAARDDPEIGVIILTGRGSEAFCSGGDQRVRGDDGYRD